MIVRVDAEIVGVVYRGLSISRVPLANRRASSLVEFRPSLICKYVSSSGGCVRSNSREEVGLGRKQHEK